MAGTTERPDGLPPFKTRPTVRLDHGMPEKDSVLELSDSAFRLLIEAICYCSRQESDGRVPKAQLRRMATTPNAAKELVTQGHMAEQDGAWVLVDYLCWNRAATEIDSFRASKGESGAKGAHARWHVPRRQRVKGCIYCFPEEADCADG